MKIKTLLLFSLCMTAIYGHSQKQDVIDWQKIHPNVIFIESGDFNSDFEEKLIALNQEYIVYSEEITMNDIHRYANQAIEKSSTTELRDDGGEQIIKDWLGKNQHVKIVPNSYFNAMSSQDKEILALEEAIILIGESLTTTDIENYEANH